MKKLLLTLLICSPVLLLSQIDKDTIYSLHDNTRKLIKTSKIKNDLFEKDSIYDGYYLRKFFFDNNKPTETECKIKKDDKADIKSIKWSIS